MFTVTTSEDSGPGSLRNALSEANLLPFAKILFLSSVTDPIILTSGELLVSTNCIFKNKSGHVIEIHGSESRIFHVTAGVNFVKMKGLKLGKGESNSFGGAIYVEDAKTQITLMRMLLKGNKAQSGGAIFTRGSCVLISCHLKMNQAESQGGAIWSGGSVTLIDSKVIQNEVTLSQNSSGGGGIYVDNGNISLVRSEVSFNRVDPTSNGCAGGILLMTGNIYISDTSSVNSNVAYNYPGIFGGIGNIYVQSLSTVNSNESTNTENPGGGGAISITVGSVYITDSEVSCNKAKAMESAGVLSAFGNIISSRSQFTQNRCGGPGGAMACNFDGSIILTEVQISENTGGSLGGAIANFSPSTLGIVSITRSQIINNTLTNEQTIGETIEVFLSTFILKAETLTAQANLNSGSGGQYVIQKLEEYMIKAMEVNERLQNIPEMTEVIAGGAIGVLLPCGVNIDQSEIRNNFAGKEVKEKTMNAIGGGIFVYSGTLNIQGSKVSENTSLSQGGGIWSGQSLYGIGNRIEENDEGGVYTQGEATIIDSEIWKNTTPEVGGGIENNGNIVLIGMNIERNSAKDGGGIYSNTSINVEASRVEENKPNNIVISEDTTPEDP